MGEKRKREKDKRRKEQEKNVRKKEKEKQDHKKKTLDGMKQKEEKEKSWQGEKIAEFKKEQKEFGKDDGIKAVESSDDDDAAYYEQEIGEKPDKDLFSKKSGSSKAFDGGKRFNSKKKGSAGNKGSAKGSMKKFDNENPKSGKKVKRKVKVFNTEGVGPSFKKGGGKEKLRGVKSGRINKKKRKY